MIIRPNEERIEKLYKEIKQSGKNMDKYLLPCCTAFFALFPIMITVSTKLAYEIADTRSYLDLDEALKLIPIFAIVGAVIGFAVKPFVSNLKLKDASSFISELKNSGIKIENDLITGRMLKSDQTTSKATANIELLPRKSYDVAFKISQISNIEIVDKVLQKINYSKYCIITVGTDKYYLMCLTEQDASALREYILNHRT
ncbi:MAG: hypothetical protein PUB43_09145 [Oscillospiraceae bacterium]|nr:hypothetical protein [Oscillospiraceae bacterium]